MAVTGFISVVFPPHYLRRPTFILAKLEVDVLQRADFSNDFDTFRNSGDIPWKLLHFNQSRHILTRSHIEREGNISSIDIKTIFVNM